MAIVPNMANVDGKPIIMTADGTGADPSVITLPTYAPKIDLRIGHPVLSLFAMDNTVGSVAIYTPALEQARATAPGANEWSIYTSSEIQVDNGGGNALKVIISYIPFGTQQA